MRILTEKINLDLNQNGIQATIDLREGDIESRLIIATLRGYGDAFRPDDNVIAVIRAKKPDGTIIYNNCLVEDGKVKFLVTSQYAAVVGNYNACIELIKDGVVLYSPKFSFHVAANELSDSEVESSSEYTELTTALEQALTALELAQNLHLLKFVENLEDEGNEKYLYVLTSDYHYIPYVWDAENERYMELESNLEELAEFAYLLSIQKERVDNLLAEAVPGSTTRDLEVIDGRTGYDGITYANLGTAIREQINDLHIENNSLENSMIAADDNLDNIKANKSDVNTTTANIESEIAVERARIDQIANTPGSTTGDLELADIRVGADGKTYSSAGDAVRGQIGDIRNDFENEIVNYSDYSKYKSFSNTNVISKTNISVSEKILDTRFSYGELSIDTDIVCEENKQVFFAAEVSVDNSSCSRVSIKYFGTTSGAVAGVGTLLKTTPSANTDYRLYGLVSIPSNFTGYLKVAFCQEYNDATTAYNKTITAKNIMILDCSRIFDETATLKDVEDLILDCGGYIGRTITLADSRAISKRISGAEQNLTKEYSVNNIGFKSINYIYGNEWFSSYETLSKITNGIKATMKNITSYGGLSINTDITCSTNKKIYLSAKVKLDNAVCSRVSIKYFGTTSGAVAGVGTLLKTTPSANTEYRLYGLITLSSNLVGKLRVSVIQEYASVEAATGKALECTEVMVLDVSNDFGKYLEPSIDELEYMINSSCNGYILDFANIYRTKDVYFNNRLSKNKVKINSMPFIMPSITRTQRPILTITYDDCSNTIYDYAYPVHKSKNAPATFYVIPSFIGTGLLKDYGYADDWDRIVEMDNNGIKIECHSYAHNYLPNLTEDGLKENFENCIETFARNGIDVNHISYPGGYYDDKVQMMAQEYFQSGRTTGAHYSDPIINGYDVQPYVIGAYCFDNRNVTWFKNRIDDAFDNNKWLCVFLHAIHPDGEVPSSLPEGVRTCMTPSELAEVIDYANDKGVEIVTLEEALRTFAPIFYWCDRNANAPMIIQRNGVIANDVQGQEPYLL